MLAALTKMHEEKLGKYKLTGIVQMLVELIQPLYYKTLHSEQTY